jgi:ketosteroid isomerase-like protein
VTPSAHHSLIDGTYAALNDRDLSRLVEHMHDEVEFVSVTAQLEGRGGIFRGHDGMREYVRLVDQHWNRASWQLLRTEDAGEDRIVTTVLFTAEGAGSNVSVAHEIALVFTVADGKARRIEAFLSPEAARAAT